MTTYSDTATDLIINRLTKTQFDSATGLDPTQEYHVDPEFAGGKLLETTADGDIKESSQTIPTVNNPTITITQGGVTKGSFTLNQSTDDTIALDAGGGSPLPSQTGQSGKFLTTDGTDASWGRVKTNDLFDSKWTDYQLNDQNWLRADTFSWQDGTVYSEAYNHLVDDIDGKTATTETIDGTTVTYYLADDGHKIVDVSDVSAIETVYSSTGVAWYYVLDTANQRFKLPRENPAREELIQTIRAKGSGVTLGLTDGTNNVGLRSYSSYQAGTICTPELYGASVGTTGSNYINNNKGLGVTTDPTKSGIISSITDSTSVYKGKKYLYFYVGQFSQSATEQTAGLNAELFNGKADVDLSNANKYNLIMYALENIQNTDSTKVGYIYSANGSNINVFAPAGGKWLILSTYEVNDNTGVAYVFAADILKVPGEIIDGGTKVSSARSGYRHIVALLKIQ